MSEALYFGMVGLFVLAVLMFFRPVRDFVLGIVGAKSLRSAIWALISTVLVAHWTVIRNFAPRNVVLPTLDDHKTTNAD